MYLHEVGLIAVENALNDINIEDDTVKQQLERIVYALATVTVGLPGGIEAEKNIIPSYPPFLKNFKATNEYTFLVPMIIAAFMFAIQRKIGKGDVSKQQRTLCAFFHCGANGGAIFKGALASPACARAREELEEDGSMPSEGSKYTALPLELLAKATGVSSECAAERAELMRFEQATLVMKGALDTFQNDLDAFGLEALEDAVAKKGKGDHVIPRLLVRAKTVTVVRKRHALAIIDGIDGVDAAAASAARNTINSLDGDSYVTIVRKKDVEAWETPLLEDGRFPLLVDAEDAVEAFAAGGDDEERVKAAKTVLSFAVGSGVNLSAAAAQGLLSADVDVEKTGQALFQSQGANNDWRLVITAGLCAAAFAVLLKKGAPGSVEREAIEAALLSVFASGATRVMFPSVLEFVSCQKACAIVPLPLDGGNTSSVQSKLIGEAAGNAHPDDIFKKLMEAKHYLMATEIGEEVLARLLDDRLEEGRYEEAVRTAREDPKKKPSFWLHEACADAKLVEAGVDDAQLFPPDKVPLLDSYITEVTEKIVDLDHAKRCKLVARAKTLLRWCVGDGYGALFLYFSTLGQRFETNLGVVLPCLAILQTCDGADEPLVKAVVACFAASGLRTEMLPSACEIFREDLTWLDEAGLLPGREDYQIWRQKLLLESVVAGETRDDAAERVLPFIEERLAASSGGKYWRSFGFTEEDVKKAGPASAEKESKTDQNDADYKYEEQEDDDLRPYWQQRLDEKYAKFAKRVAAAPGALQPKNANLAFLEKASGMAKPTRPAPPTRLPFDIAEAWGKEKTGTKRAATEPPRED